MKKHSKVLVVLDRASELSTFDAEVFDEEVGEKMTHLFQKVQHASATRGPFFFKQCFA